MDKPTKPSNLVPRSFGGVKNNFSESLQSSGYEDGVPAIYGGDNLNYQLDSMGKEFDYCEKICDYINAIPINKTPIVNANNKLVYTQYDIRVYSVSETYYIGDYVTGIVDNAKHIYQSLQNNNIGQSLSNSTYWKRVDIISDVKTIGRNIGEVVTSTIPLSDVGLHLLDGTLISGSGIYSDFVDYISNLYNSGNYSNIFATETAWQSSVSTYGSCGKFVYNSTNNTVRLPKISNILQGTTDVNALGTLISAGLPNITGTYDYAFDANVSYPDVDFAHGAFEVGETWSDTTNKLTWETSPSQIAWKKLNLNASNSSSIYGNSNTVQPQTIKVLYYIVVATTTKTDIEVDIDEIATDLNNKADRDLSNIDASQSAKNMIIGWDKPDLVNKITLTWESAYTCPSNGFIYITGNSQSNKYVWLDVNSDSFRISDTGVNYVVQCSFFIPVSVGDIVKGRGGLNTQEIVFYPAKGVN